MNIAVEYLLAEATTGDARARRMVELFERDTGYPNPSRAIGDALVEHVWSEWHEKQRKAAREWLESMR